MTCEKIEVTVIVVTYNPSYNKLLSTVKSIINQVGVCIDIVISDDGSSINYFDEIENYLKSINFTNYSFICHNHNVGTCQNIYDALVNSKGEYIKVISPGDFLFDSNTLKRWLNYVKQNKSDISFGKIINYHVDGNSNVIIDKVLFKPQLIDNYLEHKNDKAQKAFLLLSDIPIGASFLVNKRVMIKYLEIIVGKVIYAEDFSVKLMILDGIELNYYNENVIWYEYGSGISTSRENKWSKLLFNDLMAVNEIIMDRKDSYSKFGKKYSKYLMKEKKIKLFKSILKYIYFPDMIIENLKKKLVKKMTDSNIDNRLLLEIIKDD